MCAICGLFYDKMLWLFLVLHFNLFYFSRTKSSISSPRPVHSCKGNQVFRVLVLSEEAKERLSKWQPLTTINSQQQDIKSRTIWSRYSMGAWVQICNYLSPLWAPLLKEILTVLEPTLSNVCRLGCVDDSYVECTCRQTLLRGLFALLPS